MKIVILVGLFFSAFLSTSAIGGHLYFKNSMTELYNPDKNNAVYISRNNGTWEDVAEFDLSNPLSLSDLITFNDGDEIQVKIVYSNKRFVTEPFNIHSTESGLPSMFVVSGTILPENLLVRAASEFGDATYTYPLLNEIGHQYKITVCGGAGIIIACSVGNYGELVIQFAGFTSLPVFFGSGYIDELFFDQFERNQQEELLDNKGQYFSGLFYHEIKVWDKKEGLVFDLKAGGVGLGLGEATSIKFTRW